MTVRKSKRGLMMGAAVAAVVAFSACGGPMKEGIRTDTPTRQTAGINDKTASKGKADEVAAPEEADVAPPPKTKGVNPFEMNPRMEEIVRGFSGSDLYKARILHTKLNAHAPGGVKVMEMEGRPPRTAAEAFEEGGDCTDLANIALAMLDRMDVPGGALVVHFDKDPENSFHMVPYVQAGSKKIILDLQADLFGTTADGDYTEVRELTYRQARYIYYAEKGDFHRDQGEYQDAIASYKKSISIYDTDAYVHHSLGWLYMKTGNEELVIKHYEKAAELDPEKYGKDAALASYNESIRLGNEAVQKKRWAECTKHFGDALNSGEELTAEEKEDLGKVIQECNQRIP